MFVSRDKFTNNISIDNKKIDFSFLIATLKGTI